MPAVGSAHAAIHICLDQTVHDTVEDQTIVSGVVDQTDENMLMDSGATFDKSYI